MLSLTERKVHARNICSDVQGVWTEHSELLVKVTGRYFINLTTLTQGNEENETR